MPQPKKGPRLGSNPSHQKLLLSTLAAQLFTHEAINTTEAKAKALRPYAEKLITYAKRGDLAARREVLKDIPDRDVVARLLGSTRRIRSCCSARWRPAVRPRPSTPPRPRRRRSGPTPRS